ncbi:hypothetical protein GCM10010967_33070 [Dyadobacter beijingensis]|uniref:Beta-propeller repeat-containing protein n=1 Tax=Dyadobacter beijingensis TaxID=365489 RepID=A0ABQ2I356_9BACT|nr:SBBP repeat-containing protein [Dyadobacter beijingensis]GGM96752.1 hypothetical protein GCM10010967_33070 [Dyadobacter beijingensis]
MKYLYAAVLCLLMCQCKEGRTDLQPAPDSPDTGSKTGFKAETTLISAFNALGGDVAVDDSNYVYVTGTFYATSPFGTAAGNEDIFLAKYKPSGELVWSRTLGGPGYDEGRGIDLDKEGNIYVTGDFAQTISLDGHSATSRGSEDAFVAKFDRQGGLQWLRSYGSDGGERGHAVAVDGEGNVYATGEFQGTGFFEGNPLQSAGEFDAFLVKYNTLGDFQWARSGGGAGRDTGYGLAADVRTGDVYVTGYFTGNASFGSANVTAAASGPGQGDVFMAKYSPQGAFQWLRQAGNGSAGGGFDAAVDGLGDVYFLKRNSTVGYLIKYDANGASKWEQMLRFGGDGMGVAADRLGNAYVVTSGAAISKYDANGVLQQVQIPRSTDVLSATGIAVNQKGKLFVTGNYRGTLTFGGVSKTDAGWLNMFAIGGDL